MSGFMTSLVPMLSNGFALQAFANTSTDLLPLVFLALLIDAAIVAIWWMAGAVLANNRVKAAAKGEAAQLLGTAIIAAIILGSLVGFGAIYLSSVGIASSPGPGYTVLSPAMIWGMCQNDLGSSSYLSFASTAVNLQSDLADNLCSVAHNVQQGYPGPDHVYYIDYPLAASGVVIANLTNQVGLNFNDTFILDEWLGFLSKFNLTVALCVQTISKPGACTAYPILAPLPLGTPPIPFAPIYVVYFKWSETPMAGLYMVQKSLDTVSTLLYTTLGVDSIQLIFIDTFIYIWPFLIFVGLVMRGLFFTRKLGGLFIAIGIGAILFYPTVFSIEYLISNNPDIVPVTQVQFQCGGTYNFNFFVYPRIGSIASNCSCWPAFGVPASESAVWLQWNYGALPWWLGSVFSSAVGYVGGIISSGLGGSSSNPLSVTPTRPEQFGGAIYPTCQISQSEQMMFDIMQSYGIMGVTSYFLPILNILITIAAIVGLSGVLGGETSIPGISRLV